MGGHRARYMALGDIHGYYSYGKALATARDLGRYNDGLAIHGQLALGYFNNDYLHSYSMEKFVLDVTERR